MCEPFALEVYRRFLAGESIRVLAESLHIPEDRIEQRLRAAAVYFQERVRAADPVEACELAAVSAGRPKPD